MRVKTSSFHCLGLDRPKPGVELGASHFLASSEASRFLPNFPSCSQGRGGDVSAPDWGRKFSPEPRAFPSQAGPCGNAGRGTRLPLEDPWNVSMGPPTQDRFVCGRCKLRGLRQIMGLNEEGASPPSLRPLIAPWDGTGGGRQWGWREICIGVLNC